MLLKTTFTFLVAALSGLAPRVLGHPGEKIDRRAALQEANIRHTFADLTFQTLSKCEAGPEIEARKERAMKRRLETFQKLRAERGIKDGKPLLGKPLNNCINVIHSDMPFVHRRNAAQFAKWAATSHDRTGTLDFTSATPNSEIFSANSTCILTPDNIIGPYYVLGEQIRSNIVEDMQGVPLHLEIRMLSPPAVSMSEKAIHRLTVIPPLQNSSTSAPVPPPPTSSSTSGSATQPASTAV
jgi:hypothetical protein